MYNNQMIWLITPILNRPGKSTYVCTATKGYGFTRSGPGPSGALPGPEFHINFLFLFLAHQVLYQV
jgi:hypothetical protein